MGNLAIKCESHWQERKGVSKCGRTRTVDVRVMKADGTGVEEFNRPVVVAEVMYQFPEYVVVRWCPRRNTKLGKRGQLRVLQRHEVLLPGEIYILFPIPIEVIKQKNTTSRRSRRMQAAKDRLSQLLQRSGLGSPASTAGDDHALQEEQQPLRYDEKPGNDETQLPPLPTFKSGAKPHLSPADLFGGEEVDAAGAEEEEGKSSRLPDLYLSPFFAGSSWRPALVSIPESPIGFHSLPGSPNKTAKTPVAFRLIPVRSCPRKSVERNGEA